MLPARAMPVTTEVRGIHGHHDQMTCAGPDLLLTARAEVGLAGLERVDQKTDVDLVVQRGISAHSRITAMTARAAATMT
jgi:hypothetical protein